MAANDPRLFSMNSFYKLLTGGGVAVAAAAVAELEVISPLPVVLPFEELSPSSSIASSDSSTIGWTNFIITWLNPINTSMNIDWRFICDTKSGDAQYGQFAGSEINR